MTTNPFTSTDHKRIAAVLAKVDDPLRREQLTAHWCGVFRSFDRSFQAADLQSLVGWALRRRRLEQRAA